MVHKMTLPEMYISKYYLRMNIKGKAIPIKGHEGP
jgi:hypothetical protein